MAAYLAEHLPHLQSLHTLLGLPESALQSDQNHIELEIKNAVTTLVRNRESEVDNWRDAISEEKRGMVSLGRALGDKGRDLVHAVRRESESIEALPLQHEKLIKQRAQLEQEYDERLSRIENVRAQIDTLSTLLGPPFEPAAPLEPIAGPSRLPPVAQACPPRTRAGRKSSIMGPVGHTGSRSVSATSGAPPTAAAQAEGVPWVDVSDEVVEQLQAKLQRAIEERESRFQQLVDQFHDLLFLHSELALPPIPISQPHHFPISLLPSRQTEERPGAHAMYEKALSRYISANLGLLEQLEEDDGEKEDWSAGLDGVEPEVGLLIWTGELDQLWSAEKDSRIERIQAIYNELEPLWIRLEIDQETQDLFMEMNRGCGEMVIKAYEAELDRCLELRRSSLSSFVLSARKEIELLWDELMLSEDERSEFGPFINDQYSEELLQAHEDEAERLKAEIESKATILPKVRDWHGLKNDEGELERSEMDPNRFSKRGGAMLREEKLRKRVGILLPRVETELLTLLPSWEEANGRPFMVQGERVIDTIHDVREAKEQAKEAKKRARQGLGPAKPATKATPGAGMKRAAPTSTAQSKKRVAPTPTPLGNATGVNANSKRQKVSAAPSTLKQHAGYTSLRAVSNPLGGKPTPGNASPTPLSHLPRGVGRSVSGQLTRLPTMTLIPKSTSMCGMGTVTTTLGGMTSLKSMGRRQSFKPRQSVAGGFIVAARQRQGSWDLQEEEEQGEIIGLDDSNVF